MWIILVAGVLITLPAIVVVLWFIGHPMMLPALASLALNSLPFLAFAFLWRSRGDSADQH